MGTKMEMVVAAVNTSTGVQDFTISGFGDCVGAILILNSCLVAGTRAHEAFYSLGFISDGRSRVVAGSNEHAANPTQCVKRAHASAAVMILDNVGGDAGLADFDSFITDGVRIDWTTAPGAAHLLGVILIGGSAKVIVDDTTASASVGGTEDLIASGLGQVDAVFIASNIAAVDNTARDDMHYSFGWAVKEAGGISQCCDSYMAEDGTTDEAAAGQCRTDFACIQSDTVLAVRPALEVTAFGENTVEVTTRNAAAAIPFIWLAISTGGANKLHADVWGLGNVSGNVANTGHGFQPTALLMAPSLQAFADVDTQVTSILGPSHGIGFRGSSGDGDCFSFTSEHTSPTSSDTQSLVQGSVIVICKNTGPQDWIAAFVSHDSDGVTLNVTNTVNSERCAPLFTIGPDIPPIAWMAQHVRRRALARHPWRARERPKFTRALTFPAPAVAVDTSHPYIPALVRRRAQLTRGRM